VATLALLVERYPNLRIGQLLAYAIGVGSFMDLYAMEDAELARALNQLFVNFTQFEAAGIKP
jgi:hypothetical protein